MVPATNEAQCTALKGCCEAGMNCNDKYGLTDKSATECTRCGGQMVPFYNFEPGALSLSISKADERKLDSQ
jgi:hypothetical protein